MTAVSKPRSPVGLHRAGVGMGLKQHTIIFVPHARARFRRWRVSSRQLAALLLTLLLLTGLAAVSAWSYLGGGIDQGELQQVRTENERLRAINLTFEKSIRSLQTQLSEYEERTRQLAIVAGLDTLATGDEAGVGGQVLPPLVADPTAALGSSDGGFGPELQARLVALDSRLEEVEAVLGERLRWISAAPTIAPVRGLLTSGFGNRDDPITGAGGYHEAIDIAAAPGQPIKASGDGTVLRAGEMGPLGTAVVLAHGFGLTSRYGHLARLAVTPGQRVRRGDVLGYVGSTGRSTGYHLHYEVWVDGQPVDPLAYILDGPFGGS